MGGFMFHFLESDHETEFINDTMNIYFELLREYINLTIS